MVMIMGLMLVMVMMIPMVMTMLMMMVMIIVTVMVMTIVTIISVHSMTLPGMSVQSICFCHSLALLNCLNIISACRHMLCRSELYMPPTKPFFGPQLICF